MLNPVLKIAGITALVLVATATLFGWSHFGTDILLNAAASGMSWCF
ncbi:MAG: hypothetical protein JWM58_4206 [Rhizobium sp.]|nr:hypothetical protein [Rhizobium sp.]